MKNRKFLSTVAALLALICATLGILIFGASAQGTQETYVVDGVGEGEKTFATIRDALLFASEKAPKWEGGSHLTVSLAADDAVETTDNDILFDISTIFTKDHRKLPITITSGKKDGSRAVILLTPEGSTTSSGGANPKEDWHCTNDYTFLNVDIKVSRAGDATFGDMRFFAGSGNVVFDGVTFGTTEEGKKNVNLFFSSDNNIFFYNNASEKLYDTWTEENVSAEKARYESESGGLLRSSLTFKNTTYNHMPSNNQQVPWMCVKRCPSAILNGKDGVEISSAETEARVIVDEGADLGRISGFAPANSKLILEGKTVIEVRGGKVAGISADPACYISEKTAGKAKHAVVDVILKGGEVNTLGFSGAAFAVTGGAHSDYDESSEINIFVEKGAVINGNLCAIGGLGSNANEAKHILSPKGSVNVHLNGGKINGSVLGVSNDKIGHKVGGNINIFANGTAITGSIYGMNNQGTVSGNLLVAFSSDFAGTASAMNAGTLTQGANAGVEVKSGTVAGKVSAVSGTATVQKGAQAYLKLSGGTVKKQFLIAVGDTFSVEEGGKISAYVHGGNLLSAKVGGTTSFGTLFSTVNADSYTNVDKAYTKNGILTYPDNLKKGSKVYIEIGQAEKYSAGSFFAPVQGAVIGGDLHIKYLPGIKLSQKGSDTIRNTYGGIVLGNYTLEINPEGKDAIDAAGVAIQGEWSGKVLGDAFVTAKNLTCYNFFSVAGRNSTTTLDTVTATGLVGFTRGSYNTGFDVVNGENISRIDTIENHFKNVTVPTLYAVGYNTSAYKMRATIVNNFTNCNVSSNLICAGYRYAYEGKTHASSILGTITSNFLGGNRISGILFGGSSSGDGSSLSSEVVNQTGKIALNFNAPTSNPDEINVLFAGNGHVGNSILAESCYLDGSVEAISVNVGNGTTFTGDVFLSSRGGTFAAATEFTANGGVFQGAVKGKGIATIKGGTFLKSIQSDEITLKGGTFHNAPTAQKIVLADGAKLTLKESGAILATEVKGKVSIHKADPWGAYDMVYVKAPAEAAPLITITDAEETKNPFIFSQGYEVRGWYPALSATLVLKERIYLKLSMDAKVAESFKAAVGDPVLTISYDGKNLNLTTKDLAGSGYLLPAVGAEKFDLPLTYALNGETVLSTSIQSVAARGASYYASYQEIANLFYAISQYGNAAAEREFAFTTNDLLAIQRYGNNEANIDAKKISLSRDKTYTINFTSISLLMGDTVGLRLKVSDATKANLAGAKVYLNSVSSKNLLKKDLNYLLNENSIDLFVHAGDFETLVNLIVLDAKNNVCMNIKTSVAYLMYEMVNNDLTGGDGSAKNKLDNTRLQATALLVTRTDEYLNYLAELSSDKDEKITLPEGYTVGYARIDCTPADPLAIYDATAYTAVDSLMITCTAVSDGENAALIISVDFKGISRSVATSAMKLIEEAYGIPEERIMISATHTHSAPSIGGTSAAMTRWIALFHKQLHTVVGQALKDLAPAEAYAGVTYTEGINFVRRCLLADGTYKTNPAPEDNPIAYESESDKELRTLHFVREGKKDIVLMNFQTHYGLYKEAYSADFIHYLRQFSESEMDIHFGYYSGASGNLNMTNRLIPSSQRPARMDQVKAMWEAAKKAMATEESIEMGKVRGVTSLYDAKVLQDSEEDRKIARAIDGETDATKKAALMEKYGITSTRWVQGVITRSNLGETQAIPFTGISFGEISFSSSPIEQFDANAKWVRDNSPFKMTFTLSLTNGSYGYVPTAEAFPHKSYEVYVCRYAPGSGEEFAQEQLRLLNLCYNAQ